ncbi:hypothetical protein V1512DRAFT_263661 [Lipomyces arxii]|uniref:uncharacterized protein n=1 Tax=Lipomyces arxii TaxID=56418 RepID=UPI0034CDCF83
MLSIITGSKSYPEKIPGLKDVKDKRKKSDLPRKPKRVLVQVDDESLHTVNFPVNQFDPTVLPPEHVSQMPLGLFVVTKRYATSVDERHCLTVFEYNVNGQCIMWDYYSGYVHLTGLWKAIGNTKADIVKLVDNCPDLEPVIRRVRGGFLKIQGTWLPFDVARTLASRTCYHIRFALIPLFGPDFPAACLTPDEPGFGQLQLTLTESARRRRKRPADQSLDSSPRRRKSEPVSPVRHLSSPNWRTPPTTGPRAPVISRMVSFPGPPGPVKLDFLQNSALVSSRSEFLDALQATRSLQLLSSGTDELEPMTSPSADTDFECGGLLWRWDGKQELDVVGYARDARDDSELLTFACVAEEHERERERDRDRDTPALSEGSASPVEIMIRSVSECASPKLALFPSDTDAGRKGVMTISGLLT